MSVQIFLQNVHSDFNAGDLALSRVTVKQLQENFPNCQITLSMNDPKSYTGDLQVIGSYFNWAMTYHQWHWHRLAWLGPASLIPVLTKRFFGKAWFGLTPRGLRDWLSAFIRADLIVSTAGGFFYSSGHGLTLLLTSYSLILAILAGKPLYIFPQSIGPFKFFWERPLARWIYSRARIVMTREPISADNLSDCGLPRQAVIVLPDIAFGFKGAEKDVGQAWLVAQGIDPAKDRPLLGMTVMDWAAFNKHFDNQKQYEDAILAAIRYFVTQYGGRVLLLPQVWGPTKEEDDRLTALQLAERLPELGKAVIAIRDPLSPELLQAIFGEMDLVIGTRMHSNIFASTRCVPVIPIGYLHKTLGIARMAGLDEWVIDIEEVDAEILVHKLTALWEQRHRVREHLRCTIPVLIEESQKAGRLTAQDFLSLQ